jgi:hypothetical protein
MLRAYLTDIYLRLPINAFRWAGLDTNTDIATTNKGNQTALTRGTMSRTNDPGIIAYWDYAIVRDLNVFLEKIVETPISETLKAELEGEARTLRAMIYFEKHKRYGSVHFFAEDSLIGRSTSAPWEITWQNPPAGKYNVMAVVHGPKREEIMRSGSADFEVRTK